jgi:hypothetical protein
MPAQSFGDHDSGLNRLAKADVIRDKDTPDAELNRHRRGELVRKQIQLRVDGGHERSILERAATRSSQSSDRLMGRRVPHTRRAATTHGPIEWRKKRATFLPRRDVVADDGVLTAESLDEPALLPDPDAIDLQREGCVQKLPPWQAPACADFCNAPRKAPPKRPSSGLER